MGKSLIIFGNGLGMALDPEHFALKKAMQRVWECEERLSTEEKDLIGALKGITPEVGPRSESDLIATQQALGFLTDFRHSLGDDALAKWFTDDAIEFPSTLRKYVFEVAHDLFNYQIPSDKQEQWEQFLRSLILFIKDTRSHIATLNYDDLLYSPIIDGHLVDGELIKLSKPDKNSNNKAPYLRDGFHSQFRPDMFGWNGDCGHYLHLHGSPLFVCEDKVSKKLTRGDLTSGSPSMQRQIVLANRENKEDIIERSEILEDYWKNRLPKCISDASTIIFVGYSGEDDHLNRLVKDMHEGETYVIEWEGSKHYSLEPNGLIENNEIVSEQYWQERLGVPKDNIIKMSSILVFTDWYNPKEAIIPF